MLKNKLNISKNQLITLLVLGCLLAPFFSEAQYFRGSRHWKKYRKQISVGIGASQVLSDLGGRDQVGSDFIYDMELAETRYSVGVGYRYFIKEDFSIRGNLIYAQLQGELSDKMSSHSNVLSELTKLIEVRTGQPAFHPNATQFTLHLGLQLFGFWRQSQNRKKSIFCISNVTNSPIDLPISELNLIITESWFDLISGNEISDLTQTIQLSPYQTVWLSNH